MSWEDEKRIKINCQGAEAVPYTLLRPWQGDLKTLTIENYERCKAELLRDGFCEPITVWKRSIDPNQHFGQKHEYVVLNGHQRLSTIKEMVEHEKYQVADIPVSIAFVESEEQANDLVLALTSQFGEMSDESLSKYIKERNLKVTEVVERFRFPETDTENVIRICDDSPKSDDAAPRDGGDEDAVPEPAVDPRVSRGDVFILGQHVLMCGDSSDEKDVACLMGYGGVAEKADMVFTDPPYNVAGESKNFAADVSKAMGDLKEAEWDQSFDPTKSVELLKLHTSDKATVYVCTSHFLVQRIWDLLNGWSDFQSYCVWAKPNPMPSLSKRHWTWNTELIVYATKKGHTFNFPDEGHALSCFQINKHSDGTHPTQKPVALVEHAILHSSNPGDLVLDTFGGSGTTLVAATKTSRRCRMMEIDPKYVRVTIERWEKLTGRVAEKASA